MGIEKKVHEIWKLDPIGDQPVLLERTLDRHNGVLHTSSLQRRCNYSNHSNNKANRSACLCGNAQCTDVPGCRMAIAKHPDFFQLFRSHA